jgi:hypothetical protein
VRINNFIPSLEPEQIIIPRTLTAEIHAAIQSVRFIAQHIKDADKDNEVSLVCVVVIVINLNEVSSFLKIHFLNFNHVLDDAF